jgi:superfamily I DNA/RNA helicase
LSFRDERAEAEGVAALAHGLIQREEIARSQILVLLRGDFHGQFSKLIRERLTACGVPSYDPAEVDELLEDASNRRMVEMLRLVSDPEDSIAWASLLKLTSGIGDVFADYIYARSRDARTSFGRALLDAFNDDFPNASRATARRAKALIEASKGGCRRTNCPERQSMDGGTGSSKWLAAILYLHQRLPL